MDRSRRLSLALAVFVVWSLVTIYGGRLIFGQGVSLLDLVRHGISYNILLAATVVVGACLAFGWRDVGVAAPRPGTLRVLWFPLIYLGLLFGVALALGFPAQRVMLFLAINTLLVGLSEELMFRGILFRAFLTRLSLWPSIIATTAMFGSVHILNGFGTGDWSAAVVQAVAAALSGITLMAIMLRTGSILVAIAYHSAWDFATFTVAAAQVATPASGATPGTLASVLMPLGFVVPNALYGLYLLRHAGRDPAVRG